MAHVKTVNVPFDTNLKEMHKLISIFRKQKLLNLIFGNLNYYLLYYMTLNNINK